MQVCIGQGYGLPIFINQSLPNINYVSKTCCLISNQVLILSHVFYIWALLSVPLSVEGEDVDLGLVWESTLHQYHRKVGLHQVGPDLDHQVTMSIHNIARCHPRLIESIRMEVIPRYLHILEGARLLESGFLDREDMGLLSVNELADGVH